MNTNSVSIDDLNKAFCDQTSPKQSFILSDSSCIDDYFLRVTSCESSPEQIRCTTASFNAIRHMNYTFESNSDQDSLIKHNITEVLIPNDIQGQIISDSSDLSKKSVSSIRVTCKEICSHLVRPIRKKLLKRFTKNQISSGKEKISNEISIESKQEKWHNEAIGMNNYIPIHEYASAKYQNVALSCDAYRVEPERLDVGQSDIEVFKSNFNQCGEIIYYYV